MTTFLQLHFLTAYGPSNLNRDDMGRPKTAIVGGAERIRVSSQSLKRAWRTSAVFRDRVGEYYGVRTRRAAETVYQKLLEAGRNEKDAAAKANEVAGVFGSVGKTSKKGGSHTAHIEQLAHLAPAELKAIDNVAARLAAGEELDSDALDALLTSGESGADIALFGRMLAAKPRYNVEAACQVAHAFSVHGAVVEDDYFTAVDDLNRGDEDHGAGHVGVVSFGSPLLYHYVCVDLDRLTRNVGDKQTVASAALRGLIEAALTVSPGGKQNSFASRARASFALAERGSSQPRSLMSAFLSPIKGQSVLTDAVAALHDTVEKMDRVYGACADARASLDVTKGEGSFDGLVSFAAGEEA